jgi:hypothetical protein
VGLPLQLPEEAEMKNNVVKLTGFKKQPIGDRICRSVYQNDRDWAVVQGMAFESGILDPDHCWFGEIAKFNEQGSGFAGTVSEFLSILRRGKKRSQS